MRVSLCSQLHLPLTVLDKTEMEELKNEDERLPGWVQ
jgi:hypothetical protein